ncbi:SLAC1 anion channel family protein (plasmid) [Proteus mirabilis]|uniref:SLAC1 anion channel family protein n=1 Tax=Proteus mirabilis TaxID=584 RepID=UPI0038F7177A
MSTEMTNNINIENNRMELIKNTPIALYAIVMGVSGLSLAWMKFQQLYQIDLMISNIIKITASAIWIILSIMYLAKFIKYKEVIKSELSHPLKLNFFAAISIGLLLISSAWYPSSPEFSFYLWTIGCVLNLVFTLLTMNIWLFTSNFRIEQVTPAWFIPVVGNIIVPIVGVHHADIDVSWFFFSIGAISWAILMPIVLYRLLFCDKLPEPLTPTLFILIAPPSVGCLAYMSLNGGEFDSICKILYFLSLFITILLITRIKKFISLPFSLSSWAYSFPLASITISTLEISSNSNLFIFKPLGWGLLIIVSLIVFILFIRTLKAMFSGGVFINK